MFVFNLLVLYGHAKCKLVTVIACLFLHVLIRAICLNPIFCLYYLHELVYRVVSDLTISHPAGARPGRI